MPVFSCGGMRYQHAWKDLPPDQIPTEGQRNLEVTIRRSLEVGISHIETARGYGTSELQLGRVLPQLPREDFICQTKVSPKPDPREFRRQFEKSLSLLKLDYVDLLGLHGINTEELVHQSLRPGGCLDAARQLQTEGKVRFIGFSTHGPTDVIVRTIQSGQFDYVNLHWYYIYPFNWPAIAAAAKQDMGVFIISPSDKGGHLYNPPDKLVELCKPLSPMVFNDLFCLRRSQVHTLSIGAARPSDFDEHLKTLPLLDRADEILPDILERLDQAAIRAFDTKFGADRGRVWLKTWHQGLPALEDTPGGLNIRTLLWLWNLVVAFEMTDFAKARYGLLGNGGHWFPGQKAENIRSLNLRQALARSPHSDRIPALLEEVHEWLHGDSVGRLSSA